MRWIFKAAIYSFIGMEKNVNVKNVDKRHSYTPQHAAMTVRSALPIVYSVVIQMKINKQQTWIYSHTNRFLFNDSYRKLQNIFYWILRMWLTAIKIWRISCRGRKSHCCEFYSWMESRSFLSYLRIFRWRTKHHSYLSEKNPSSSSPFDKITHSSHTLRLAFIGSKQSMSILHVVATPSIHVPCDHSRTQLMCNA